MQMKKSLSLIILLAFVASLLVLPAYAQDTGMTAVMVDNAYVLSDSPTVTQNGILLVPAARFAEALGGSFTFDAASSTGILQLGGNELAYRLDEGTARINGKYIKTPVPMTIKDMKLMIPAAFTCSTLGVENYTSARRNTFMAFKADNGKLTYKVLSGDTLWIISQLFSIPISTLRALNGNLGDMIYVGQKLVIKDYTAAAASIAAYTTANSTLFGSPAFGSNELGYLKPWVNITITGKTGDWYKAETPRGSGYMYYTVVGMKQDMSFGSGLSPYFSSNIPVDTSMDSVENKDYTVVKGDSIWSISQANGISDYELASANSVTPYTVLYPGQIIKIPVHIIPEKDKLNPQAGEILDWFKEGQYLFSVGKTGKLIDMATGKSFMVKRTMGSNHSDTETLTSEDTAVMKEIFGGKWIWTRRPFYLEFDGRRFAVSVAGMPHAGVDGAPFLQNVDNRSDNWGYGPNYDSIAGNGMEGHFDLYFLNSITHNTSAIDPKHQVNVLTAGGLE